MKDSTGIVLQPKRENRTRIEIVTCILRKADVPARKSHIVLTCGLSSRQATDLLNLLTVNSLIENNGEPTVYHTTTKGHEFLDYYERLCRLLQPEELETRSWGSENGQTRSIFHNDHSTRKGQ